MAHHYISLLAPIFLLFLVSSAVANYEIRSQHVISSHCVFGASYGLYMVASCLDWELKFSNEYLFRVVNDSYSTVAILHPTLDLGFYTITDMTVGQYTNNGVKNQYGLVGRYTEVSGNYAPLAITCETVNSVDCKTHILGSYSNKQFLIAVHHQSASDGKIEFVVMTAYPIYVPDQWDVKIYICQQAGVCVEHSNLKNIVTSNSVDIQMQIHAVDNYYISVSQPYEQEGLFSVYNCPTASGTQTCKHSKSVNGYKIGQHFGLSFAGAYSGTEEVMKYIVSFDNHISPYNGFTVGGFNLITCPLNFIDGQNCTEYPLVEGPWYEYYDGTHPNTGFGISTDVMAANHLLHVIIGAPYATGGGTAGSGGVALSYECVFTDCSFVKDYHAPYTTNHKWGYKVGITYDGFLSQFGTGTVYDPGTSTWFMNF